MIKQSFDFARNWEYVRYVRMSSDLQNPRSLSQQLEAIDAAVKRRGLTHWRHAGDYPDDAKSGRYIWRRPQFRKMIADMTSGRCRAKVIIVHSTDRLGRSEELAAIRAKLFREHGIIVLTVDSGLEDPLSVSGQAFAFVETLRSTGENRARAEKVLLGKMDLAAQGYWVGGRCPLGYEFDEATDVVAYRGRNRRRPSRLKVDPRTSPIVAMIFDLAHQGVGQDGIAVLLNADRDVPTDCKPFHGATIGRILDSPIYVGTLRWNYRCTDVLYDQRVSQRNKDEDVMYIADFCPPLVAREVFDEVQRMRRERGAPMREARAARGSVEDEGLYQSGRGIALTYPLSGLVTCGECGRAMNVSACGAFKAKDGSSRRYPAYVCPGAFSGACCHKRRIPEPWLRRTVLRKLRERLLPFQGEVDPPSSDLLMGPNLPAIDRAAVEQAGWFQELHDELKRELGRMASAEGDQLPAIEREIAVLGERRTGWLLSLAASNLSTAARETIVEHLNSAEAELGRLESRRRELIDWQDREQDLIDVADVASQLRRLEQTLGSANASLLNVTLAEHIDVVACRADGTVALRICRLGALAGLHDLFSIEPPPSERGSASKSSVIPRRRTARRVADEAPESVARRALDPARFAGLPEQWFWNDVFTMPAQDRSWARVNAHEVATRRINAKLSIRRLSGEFQKSKPTIVAALRHFGEQHPELEDRLRLRCRSVPKKRFDYEFHADDVRRRFEHWESDLSIGRVIGCSAPTVQAILKFAYARTGETVPTRNELRQRQAAQVRALREEGRSFSEIAAALRVSIATVHARLKQSHAAEGVSMPDQRRRESRRGGCGAT